MKWFGARAARVAAHAARGERHWRRDLHEHPDERDAFRLAQIAGLRETITDLRAQLVAKEAENARLQVSIATALSMQWLQHGAAKARRIAEEPTTEVTADQLRRTRPAAPTEQYRRPR